MPPGTPHPCKPPLRRHVTPRPVTVEAQAQPSAAVPSKRPPSAGLGKAAEGVTTLLLVTLTAGLLSEALLIPIEYAMVNLGRTRLMFNTAIVRLVVNTSIGFGLVGLYGAEAIGVGMLLGSLVALAWQWAVFYEEARAQEARDD